METVAQCVAGVVRLARRLDELSEVEDTHAEFKRDDVRATLLALLHLGSNSEAAAHAASAIARLGGFFGISSEYRRPFIAPLVALLHAGPDNRAAQNAAIALEEIAGWCYGTTGAAVEAGAFAPLVAMLQAGAESDAAEAALPALASLMCFSIRLEPDLLSEAIAQLVALLHAGAGSRVALTLARTLEDISIHPHLCDALCAAGCIAPLVEMVRAGVDGTSHRAASALGVFGRGSRERCDAIREAGGIAALMALLRVGVTQGASEDEASLAMEAAFALALLVENNDSIRDAVVQEGAIALLMQALREDVDIDHPTLLLRNLARAGAEDAVITALVAARVNLSLCQACETLDSLIMDLADFATQGLTLAMEGEDAAALRTAIDRAKASGFYDEELAAARARLAELTAQAERLAEEARRARRESVGLGDLKLPAEFECPITFDKMTDPVVASDGHTYERSAITALLARDGETRSPLTREVLQAQVFPNHALRRRIQEYEEEMMKMAEKVAETAVKAERTKRAIDEGGASAASPVPGDGGAESPLIKRARQ